MKKGIQSIVVVLFLMTSFLNCATAQDAYVGEIRLFAGNFAPHGWMFCNGQTLQLNQYQALYAILGVTYGGNGTTNFNLPDLRNRVPVGAIMPGNIASNVSNQSRQAGQVFGAEYANATIQTTITNVLTPTSNTGVPNTRTMPVPTISNIPAVVSTVQPSIGINYIICVNGIFPTRD